MSSADQLLALKQRVERLRSARDKAQGALDKTMQTLKTEFKCESLKEAKALLATMEEQAGVAKAAFDAALQDFNEKWGDKLPA